MDRRAFTLIELVIVILIISILAVTIMPKIFELKNRALDKSEDAVIAALQVAINNKHLENIINNPGADPETLWPCGVATERPFSLLSNPPPYATGVEHADDVTWGFLFNSGEKRWSIYCPHVKVGSTYGKTWVYATRDTVYGGVPRKAGSITTLAYSAQRH